MGAVVTLQIHGSCQPLPSETATVLEEEIGDWSVTADHNGERGGVHLEATHPLAVAAALEASQVLVRWQSSAAPSIDLGFPEHVQRQPYDWPTQPRILALVPHWRCEPWLGRCLTSLRQQTYPLTDIAVIDDGSVQPPLDIVKTVAGVTLLHSPQRVGPYRLIQSVIDATDYDAYLFQDADDWSTCDRTEQLLQTARSTGAELIGCQEIRVLESSQTLQAVGYPLDVNQALLRSPSHPLLHPTSLVTRSLVQRVGGFATGLQFGGDTEFLLRAHWRGRIVNSPQYGYFRRKRPESLTTDPATGLDSPARQHLTQRIKQRAIANNQAAARQEPLDLHPLKTAPPIPLHHVWGPGLRWHG